MRVFAAVTLLIMQALIKVELASDDVGGHDILRWSGGEMRGGGDLEYKIFRGNLIWRRYSIVNAYWFSFKMEERQHINTKESCWTLSVLRL